MEPRRPGPDQPPSGLTPRALALGAIGTALLAAFIPYSDLVLRGTWLGLTAFPIGAFCAFLLLLAGRSLPHGVGRLSPAESLTAYAMMVAGCGVASFGLTGLLVPYAAAPHYFATPENHYHETLLRYLPSWLMVPPEVATALYEGLPPGEEVPWRAWVRPAVGWGLLVSGVYLLLFAVAHSVRRAWIEEERLVFPLVQLPVILAGADPDNSVDPRRDPLVWAFLLVPLFIHGINGLHFHVPAVPQINVHRLDLGQSITGRVGEAVRPLWLRLLFSVVGLTFLLPGEIGASLWFFYLFFVAQQALGAVLGQDMPFVQAFPVRRFVALQMYGGILTWAVVLLRDLARRGHADLPRLACWSGALLVLGWSRLAGASLLWVVLLFAVFLLSQLVATRLVAEAGMLYVQHPFRPLNLVLSLFGSAAPGPPRLPLLALLDHLWMLDNRSPLQPAVLQGLKLAEVARVRPASMSRALALAVVLAVPISLVAYVRLLLEHGGTGLNPWFTSYYANNLLGPWASHLVLQGERAQPADLGWLGLGALSMLALNGAHRLLWRWPLHPLGYLMGASWPMLNFWFSVLLGWLLKVMVLKSGGARLYRRLRPAFLALVLGEYLSAGVWVVVDALAGVRGHEIFTF
ncbi:MAG: hypothetical protein HUU35_00045 [Armatimonadetes bacterium]|nr:hypothetical protein [Armatimonadota bacterium]